MSDYGDLCRDMPYQQRAIDQGRKWAAGESHHNMIDDECCPDFSPTAVGRFLTPNPS